MDFHSLFLVAGFLGVIIYYSWWLSGRFFWVMVVFVVVDANPDLNLWPYLDLRCFFLIGNQGRRFDWWCWVVVLLVCFCFWWSFEWRWCREWCCCFGWCPSGGDAVCVWWFWWLLVMGITSGGCWCTLSWEAKCSLSISCVVVSSGVWWWWWLGACGLCCVGGFVISFLAGDEFAVVRKSTGCRCFYVVVVSFRSRSMRRKWWWCEVVM